jgi:DNA repair and recombination protein RAD52
MEACRLGGAKVFTEKQITALNAKLDGGAVKQRSQAGQTLSYLEGYAAIESANRIFGYGNWSGSVVELTQVEACAFEKNNKSGFRASYIVRYRVKVYSQDRTNTVEFDDVGYGSGTSYASLGDAVESATKEAVTDAMKRTLRNFGNQFGLALYDKEQRNVSNGFDTDTARTKILSLSSATIEDAREALKLNTREELIALFNTVNGRTVPQN